MRDFKPFYLLLATLAGCGQSGGHSPSYSSAGAVTAADTKYKIFVTARSDLTGSLIGTTGADLYCNSDPQAGNDIYKALLGVSTRKAPATDWPLRPNTNYYRTDGTTLIGTTTPGAIFTGTLVNSVSVLAVEAWTGLSAGFVDGNECAGFTSTGAGSGHVGQANQTSVATMISSSTANCSLQKSLYCVQQ